MSARPQRKPWFHAKSGFWCAQIDGKRHYLDRDPDAARRKLKKLLQDRRRGDAGLQEWLDAYFADLADLFLDDVKARKKPRTYDGYKEMLTLAQKHLGTRLRVGELKKLHLTKLEGALAGSCSPTTVFKALHAVQRVLSWAVENDLLELSPLAGYKKPRPRVIDDAEFQKMLRRSSPPFRCLLLALRRTGARPCELRDLRWQEVHLNVRLGDGVEVGSFFILPEHKTVTRQKQPRPRIIPLPAAIRNLLQVLARRPHGPDDHVFLNTDGRPWTRTALRSQMRRLRERVGLVKNGGENVVLYSNRHSFATAHVGRITDIELADLLGHTTRCSRARRRPVSSTTPCASSRTPSLTCRLQELALVSRKEEQDMLCPWCHGKGIADAAAADGPPVAPCLECGGCGLLHCCEGLIEQPHSPPQAPAGASDGCDDGKPGQPRP